MIIVSPSDARSMNMLLCPASTSKYSMKQGSWSMVALPSSSARRISWTGELALTPILFSIIASSSFRIMPLAMLNALTLQS